MQRSKNLILIFAVFAILVLAGLAWTFFSRPRSPEEEWARKRAEMANKLKLPRGAGTSWVEPENPLPPPPPLPDTREIELKGKIPQKSELVPITGDLPPPPPLVIPKGAMRDKPGTTGKSKLVKPKEALPPSPPLPPRPH